MYFALENVVLFHELKVHIPHNLAVLLLSIYPGAEMSKCFLRKTKELIC